MRIGVAGAFGFLGANLVAELLAENSGDEIVAFSSRTAANPLFDSRRVTRVSLDVLDPAEVRRKTAGLDVLFHFAGKVSFARREKRTTWDVNVLGSRNIFEAVLANGIRRFVYASSINVLGAPRDPRGLADETNDPYDPASRHPTAFRGAAEALEAVEASARGDYRFLARVRVAYFDSKLAAHELARHLHRARGLPVILVLPGTAVGAGDMHYAISGLVDRIYGGRIAFTLPGATSFVDAVEAARGAILALKRGKSGDSYILSGRDEENLSYREFMHLVAATARAQEGRRVRTQFLPIPAWLALPAAALAETFDRSPSLTAGLVVSGSQRHRCSSEKARRELGWRLERRLKDGIADCWRFLKLTSRSAPSESGSRRRSW